MGSYTSFEFEDLTVIDKEGLKAVVEKSSLLDENHKTAFLEDSDSRFAVFHDWKIYSYWYADFLDFLEAVSPFLRGRVWLRHEDGEPCCIIFENGNKVKIEIAHFEWTTLTPKQLKKEHEDFEKMLNKTKSENK